MMAGKQTGLEGMGIDHGKIQAALKHKSREMTDRYLKSLDDTSLDEKFKTVYGDD